MKSASLLLALVIIGLNVARETNAQVVDISACRDIEDRLSRFDCYENLNEAPVVRQSQTEEASTAVITSPDTVPIQTLESSSPAAVPEEEEVAGFGRQEPDRATVVSGGDDEKELRDIVTALEKTGPNIWTITLSSGQLWRQMEGKPYRLEVGDNVRIYQSFWGKSYRLTAPRLASFIQVQRIE
jgi:hypothetical protein